METVFTPWLSLAGGVLIGLAAVLLMLVHGQIAGATGVLAGLFVRPGTDDWNWRAAMLAGMISAPLALVAATGEAVVIQVPVSMLALVVGGLLVGVGVTLGNGCTSGHGVCGLARFSGRSLVATLTFMATTALTVLVVRHVV